MSEKKRIFIADDDKAVLFSLQKLLEASGFQAEATDDSREIVSKIKSFKPHLILLDLLMPHLGGMEICDLLNKDKETQGIPIIVLSALSGHKDIEKAYHLGIIGYIIKPYDFQLLLKEINKAISFKEGNLSN